MAERIIEDINIDEIISELPLDSVKYVDHSYEISRYILIKLKKLPQKFLAQKLSKTEAEISKWLSGTHNFTLRTISKLEYALNIELINPLIKKTVYDYFENKPYVAEYSVNENYRAGSTVSITVHKQPKTEPAVA